MTTFNNSKYRTSIYDKSENFKEGHEIYVSKKSENINESLQKDLTQNLGIKGINGVQVFSNHVVGGLNDEEFEKTIGTVLSEAPVDNIYNNEDFKALSNGKTVLTIEAKPGQLDLTVDGIDINNKLVVNKDTKNRFKHVIVLDGDVSEKDLLKIKKYLINPNENFESNLADKKLEREIQDPKNNVILDGFNDLETDNEFKSFIKKNGIPVEFEDVKLVQNYFKKVEKRNPTKVEMLLIGTYWSDHCRHTTFETQITNLIFKGPNKALVENIEKFNGVYEERKKELGKEDQNTFMQIAKSSLAFLENDPGFKGAEFIDRSEEDNASTYKLKIDLEDGTQEDWIIMFKNETHNSPTEAEPFGGAATALGGSIRDNLSARGLTFAAMRVSGAGNPTKPVSDTLAGKISQLALSIGSALGAASYGNQIGVPSTNVMEYFHPGYEAKRFEVSYVLAANKEENIVKQHPVKNDIIIMAGGDTGRDGVGGAVVSSKGSGEFSDEQMGAHVQKGNPLNERTFQRLIKRYPELTKMIKKSNDFGAGGVSVALGELARGVNIDLDEIAKHIKYSGLSDEELMISESQERMSFVIDPKHKEAFLTILKKENINAFQAGTITTESEIPKDSKYLREELAQFRKISKKLKKDEAFEKVKEFLEKNDNIDENKLNLELSNPFFGLSRELLEKYLEYLPEKDKYEEYRINANKKDRLIVNYQGKKPVNLARSFLDENGVERTHDATVVMDEVTYFDDIDSKVQKLIKSGKLLEAIKLQLSFIENSSQRMLQKGFDSSVQSTAIHAPYGGKYQDSPQGKKMVNKIPTSGGVDSVTAIISSHGFNPELMSQNTYIGGMYAVLESISSVVATGGDYKKTWLSLQEYFGKLTSDEKYGEVYAGLLGTLNSLINLKVAAIGGKDSMSGTYIAKLEDLLEGKLDNYNNQKKEKLLKKAKKYLKADNKEGVKKILKELSELATNLRLDVPPSIISFANCPIDSNYAVSSEFKKPGNKVLCFKLDKDENGIPDFDSIKQKYEKIHELINAKKVYSSSVVANGGIVESIAKLSLGNRIGFKFNNISEDSFKSNIGDILIEVDENIANQFPELIIGETTSDEKISFGEESLKVTEAKKILEGSLEKVWNPEMPEGKVDTIPEFIAKNKQLVANTLVKQPVALIPVFPGTNSDDDTKHQLEKAGFIVQEHVFNTTGSEEEQRQSRIEFANKLKNCNLFTLAGGFSFGDEPGASGKTAVNILKSKELRETVQQHYNNTDKLTLGVCNGAQMLIKQGILDNGKITDELKEDDAIIAHNDRLNHETGLVKVKITSILSPFFSKDNLGKEFMLNISHGEGKFEMTQEKFEEYVKKGQVPIQMLDEEGNPTNKYNGSIGGIAGMTDPTGRILFMMPHIERVGLNVGSNVPGNKQLDVIKNAYGFFTGNHPYYEKVA